MLLDMEYASTPRLDTRLRGLKQLEEALATTILSCAGAGGTVPETKLPITYSTLRTRPLCACAAA